MKAHLTALFRILHGDHLDLDQKAGIGKRGDADDGACRQIGLAAAEKLGVALHERLEVHRRGGAMNQEHLHLDDVGHGESKALHDALDPGQHADGLGFGVAISRGG